MENKSEEIKPRSLEDIDREYVNLCAQMGNIQFKAENNVNLLKKSMYLLVEEANKLKETNESKEKQNEAN